MVNHGWWLFKSMIPGSSKQTAILKNEQIRVAHPTGPLLQRWWSCWAFAGRKETHSCSGFGELYPLTMGVRWVAIGRWFGWLFEEPGEDVNDNTEWSLASSSPHILDEQKWFCLKLLRTTQELLHWVTYSDNAESNPAVAKHPHVVNFKFHTAIKFIMFLGFVQCSIYHQIQLANWPILWEARGMRISHSKLELWKICSMYGEDHARDHCCPSNPPRTVEMCCTTQVTHESWLWVLYQFIIKSIGRSMTRVVDSEW